MNPELPPDWNIRDNTVIVNGQLVQGCDVVLINNDKPKPEKPAPADEHN